MWMVWGFELIFFCNGVYWCDMLGVKYFWVFGCLVFEVWLEIWDDIGFCIDCVMIEWVVMWDELLLLFFECSGYVEEMYYIFLYSLFVDDDGNVEGMFCVVKEDIE